MAGVANLVRTAVPVLVPAQLN
eukprot:SAG31_NODE_43951_length_265_cov_0.602410_1_plen_21_part_01